MRVSGIDFSVNTRSIDVYVSGCNSPHCQGCHNPELWDFSVGTKYNPSIAKYIKNKAEGFSTVDKILILGGEPLDQDIEKLKNLLRDLRDIKLPIFLFTRYELDKIPEEVKELVDYIKTGEYVPELLTDKNVCYNIPLATTNQKITKVNNG